MELGCVGGLLQPQAFPEQGQTRDAIVERLLQRPRHATRDTIISIILPEFQNQALNTKVATRWLRDVAKAKRADLAVPLLQALQVSRLEANVFHCSATISACAKEGRWALALELLGTMVVTKIETHTATYSSAISACEKGGQWLRALCVLATMVTAECKADAVVYACVMSACERVGQWLAALKLLRSFKAGSLDADAGVYNIAITACARGQLWAQALAYLEEMTEANINADKISCNAAISACEKGGQWTKALKLLCTLPRLWLQPDAISCNAAISACEKCAQWEVALWLLCLMPELHLERDTITFASAISACEKGRRWAMALHLVTSMTEARVEVNTIAFSAVVHACEVCGKWALALDLLTELLDSDIEDVTVLRFQHVRTYKHNFLAGGPEDCLKHMVLVALLKEMVHESATPFQYVDTHAGCGVYNLSSREARYFRNFQDGVLRVAQACCEGGLLPTAVADYLAAQRDLDEGLYLGSAGLALRWLRPLDRAVLFETSDTVFATLQHSIDHLVPHAKVEVLQQDSYEWLARTAPSSFFEGRGLVLVDPPYDSVNSYNAWNLLMLRRLRRRWPDSCVALWYPRFDEEQASRLHMRTRELQVGPVLVAELMLQRTVERQLPGSGLLIVNPPARVHDALQDALPGLGHLLVPSGSKDDVCTRLFWLETSIKTPPE